MEFQALTWSAISVWFLWVSLTPGPQHKARLLRSETNDCPGSTGCICLGGITRETPEHRRSVESEGTETVMHGYWVESRRINPRNPGAD